MRSSPSPYFIAIGPYDSREAERAARISSHREVVSREMSALAKAGLVEKREGALIIPSLTELNAIQSSQ